jgi:transcriptional regulator with XRE-family HTH domain
MEQKQHFGNNIKRLREILGIKQDALAVEFEISQQAVSDLEKKSFIADEILDRVAKVLKVPVEVIKNFNNESAVNVISNTFNEASFFSCYHPVFNQIDKFLDIFERLLETEQEKNKIFAKFLQKNISTEK